MIQVLGFDHVNLRVADLERSVRFYTQVLGLSEVMRRSRDSGNVGLLALRAGNCIVFLQPQADYRPPEDPRQSGLDHVSLEIEATDAEELATWLRGQGVVIDQGPVSRFGAHGTGVSIYVRDPDGHRIELKQYPAGG